MIQFLLILIFALVIGVSILFFFNSYLLYSAEKIPLLLGCTFLIFILVYFWGLMRFSVKKNKFNLAFPIFLGVLVLVAIFTSLKFDNKAYDEMLAGLKGTSDAATIITKGVSPLETLRIDNSDSLPLKPLTGQLWSPDNDETIFWFDGKNWNLVKDQNKKYSGPITMKIKFNPRPGESEPLVCTGIPGLGDTVYVKYLSAMTAQICYDHWGVEGFPGNPFEIDPDRIYVFEVSFGSFYPGTDLGTLSRNVIVKADGVILLDRSTGFHPTKPEQVILGKNQVDCGVCGPQFNGQILEARRVGVRI